MRSPGIIAATFIFLTGCKKPYAVFRVTALGLIFLILFSACKRPKADFIWMQTTLGEIGLQNTSVNYKSAKWQISNGTTSNDNFMRVNLVRGSYLVKLTVWGYGIYGGKEFSTEKYLDYQGGPFLTAQTPKGSYEANLLTSSMRSSSLTIEAYHPELHGITIFLPRYQQWETVYRQGASPQVAFGTFHYEESASGPLRISDASAVKGSFIITTPNPMVGNPISATFRFSCPPTTVGGDSAIYSGELFVNLPWNN